MILHEDLTQISLTIKRYKKILLPSLKGKFCKNKRRRNEGEQMSKKLIAVTVNAYISADQSLDFV